MHMLSSITCLSSQSMLCINCQLFYTTQNRIHVVVFLWGMIANNSRHIVWVGTYKPLVNIILSCCRNIISALNLCWTPFVFVFWRTCRHIHNITKPTLQFIHVFWCTAFHSRDWCMLPTLGILVNINWTRRTPTLTASQRQRSFFLGRTQLCPWHDVSCSFQCCQRTNMYENEQHRKCFVVWNERDPIQFHIPFFLAAFWLTAAFSRSIR